jgi:hypothetical protein
MAPVASTVAVKFDIDYRFTEAAKPNPVDFPKSVALAEDDKAVLAHRPHSPIGSRPATRLPTAVFWPAKISISSYRTHLRRGR